MGVDDSHLAQMAFRIVFCDELYCFLCCLPFFEETERFGTISGISVGLGGDGADSSFGKRDDGADGQEFGLDGNAPFLGFGVMGDDGVGNVWVPPL